MHVKLESELVKFRDLIEQLKSIFHVQKSADLAFELSKQNNDAPIDLTVMAVTHGNELAGIAVINRLLSQLITNPDLLDFRLAVILANTPASFEDVRFREKDLNRSFGYKGDSTAYEVGRARELEPILKRTKILVDLHQTIETSNSGFFIFPFSQGSFELAHSLCPDLPIVTHWGGGFSKDGQCTDEFVNQSGGIGLTVELGQKGFDLYQESLGFNIVMKAFSVLKTGLTPLGRIKRDNIYSWSHIESYPEGDVNLVPRLVNFQAIEAGQEMYVRNGQSVESPKSGMLLFPKYVEKGSPRPKELYRIMKNVTMKEIQGINKERS